MYLRSFKMSSQKFQANKNRARDESDAADAGWESERDLERVGR